MKKYQWYIGTPSGVVLCVDHVESRNSQFTARVYHGYSTQAVYIEGVSQLLFELERFYDSINFPHLSTNERTFQDKVPNTYCKEERAKIMSDEELLRKHGDLGTFIIRVQHRQNSSWQGKITWMDKDKTIYFRSVWEMIKLIAGALDTVSDEGDSSQSITWEE